MSRDQEIRISELEQDLAAANVELRELKENLIVEEGCCLGHVDCDISPLVMRRYHSIWLPMEQS